MQEQDEEVNDERILNEPANGLQGAHARENDSTASDKAVRQESKRLLYHWYLSTEGDVFPSENRLLDAHTGIVS